MMTAVETYPIYLEQVNDLVKRHLENFEDRLLLAIYYAPERSPSDVFLFEVLKDFNSDSLEEEGDILEVLFGATPAFPLQNRGDFLHILLTNPEEFQTIINEPTPYYRELLDACSNGKAQTVYRHPESSLFCEAPL